MMTSRRVPALICLLVVVCWWTPRPSQGAPEDVWLFYEELAPHGNWVDYPPYGPVWYPSQTPTDWRPYLDGRWVPTEAGWVFETDEPWGWVVYHYGNWLPTEEYGWVWAPGRTWYPNTAAWRANDSHLGWAPLPPENYQPPAALAPEGRAEEEGTPQADLTAPYWTFADGKGFLLGFEEPYDSRYSYYNCGCLTNPEDLPGDYSQVPWVEDYYTPDYAPEGFYVFGPPLVLVARVVRLPEVRLQTFIKNTTIVKIRNAAPPRDKKKRKPPLKPIVPPPLQGDGTLKVMPAADKRQAAQRLARGDAAPFPPGQPRLQEAIPRAVVVPRQGPPGRDAWRHFRGMTVPVQALRPVSRRPEPPPREAIPASPVPEAIKPAPPPGPPAVTPPTGEFRPQPLAPRESPGLRERPLLPPGQVLPTPRKPPGFEDPGRGLEPLRQREEQRRQERERFQLQERQRQQELRRLQQERARQELLQQRELLRQRQQEELRHQQRQQEQLRRQQQQELLRQQQLLREQQELQLRQQQKEGRPLKPADPRPRPDKTPDQRRD